MTDNILMMVGRTKPLFEQDINYYEKKLCEIIKDSKFLVIGGAGTIGSAICRELFIRNPKVLHVVDISENNLVEVVRDIRSSAGYGTGEFATFALDCGSEIFKAFITKDSAILTDIEKDLLNRKPSIESINLLASSISI